MVDARLKVKLVFVFVRLHLHPIRILATILPLFLLAQPLIQHDSFLVDLLVLEFGVVDPVEGELRQKLFKVVP